MVCSCNVDIRHAVSEITPSGTPSGAPSQHLLSTLYSSHRSIPAAAMAASSASSCSCVANKAVVSDNRDRVQMPQTAERMEERQLPFAPRRATGRRPSPG